MIFVLCYYSLDLFFVQIIFGIAEAIIVPAFDSLYSKNLDKGKAASEWGLWEGMRATVVGVAAIIGGFVAQTYGFAALFRVMAIISFFSLAASLLFYRQKFRKKRKRKR